MLFINHRVNSCAQLGLIPCGQGMEIDLRADLRRVGAIVVHHDAWAEGADLEIWLATYQKLGHTGTVIFNTKEDGLEQRVCELASFYGVKDYFFLDTAFPTLMNWTQQKGKTFFAGRVSKYEDWRTYLNIEIRPKWLWMDCFEGVHIDISSFAAASRHFKLCLVSPELQSQPMELANNFVEHARYCEAICTKNASRWMELLK